MIKFFRKTRQKLAYENNISQYSRYAIGEIVLVVIGILIALQINNWNEARKAKIQEIKILEEIKLDLISTKNEVTLDMNVHLSILDDSQRLLDHITKKLPENDSIVRLLINVRSDLQAYPKTSGFEALKSIGINLIKNDSLRTEITNFHQLSIERIVKIGKKENPTDNLTTIFQPFITKYLTPDSNPNNIQTIQVLDKSIRIPTPALGHYEQMINDGGLIGTLSRSMIIRADKIRRHQKCIQSAERVIQLIKKELKNLDS